MKVRLFERNEGYCGKGESSSTTKVSAESLSRSPCIYSKGILISFFIIVIFVIENEGGE